MICRAPGCGRRTVVGYYHCPSCRSSRDTEPAYVSQYRGQQYGTSMAQGSIYQNQQPYVRPPPFATPHDSYAQSQYGQNPPYQQRFPPNDSTWEAHQQQYHGYGPPNLADSNDRPVPASDPVRRFEQPSITPWQGFLQREPYGPPYNLYQQQAPVVLDRYVSQHLDRRQYSEPRPYHDRRAESSTVDSRHNQGERVPSRSSHHVGTSAPSRERVDVPAPHRNFVAAYRQYITPGPNSANDSVASKIKQDSDVKQEFGSSRSPYVKPEPDVEQNSRAPLHQDLKDEPDARHSDQHVKTHASVEQDDRSFPQQATEFDSDEEKGDSDLTPHVIPTPRQWHGPWDPAEHYIVQPQTFRPPGSFNNFSWQQWPPKFRQYVDPISDQPGQYGQQRSMLPNLQQSAQPRWPQPQNPPDRDDVDNHRALTRHGTASKFPSKLNKEQRDGHSRKSQKRIDSALNILGPAPQRSKTWDENTTPDICTRCIRSAQSHWASACHYPMRANGTWDSHTSVPCASCTARAVGHRETECRFGVQDGIWYCQRFSADRASTEGRVWSGMESCP